MQRKALASLTALVACAFIAMGTSTKTQAADPTGTWSWTMPARGGGGGGGGGGAERKMTLKLKAEGEKLTGKLVTPARGGGEARETDIEKGKVSGDEISFEVTREFNNNKFTTKYNGKVTADTIEGKVERPGRNGGEPTKSDWKAKKKLSN